MNTAIVKNKVSNLKKKLNYAVAAAAATVTGGTAYCADANAILTNTLNLVFNLMRFGGIIFAGYGVVLIAKAIASPDAGDPHGITKGIGAIVGGVIMIVVPSVLKALGIYDGTFNIIDNTTT